MRRIDTEVLVIGGGATGTGIARDLAMRGFRTVVVERGDWASGTTGRYNGLLHSGSRYSVNHIENARECIQENRILRRIMPHCIEDTAGYVVATPVDDPAYGDRLIQGCHAAGIPIEEVPVQRVLREEPLVNPGIQRALRVPDAPADSFLATLANVESARQHGVRALNYHAVVELLRVNGRVGGAVCHDLVRDERVTVAADLVINAAGAWAGQVAKLVGIDIPLLCSQGSMIATNYRLVNTVITRLRCPSPVDSVMCSHSVSVLGCTDVVIDGPDHCAPRPGELRTIIDECSQLVPAARDVRRLRVWCGVRPLYRSADGPGGLSGQGLSRSHVILDHATADGVDGLLSIVGGKWTTYRLMAEQTVDQACRKLGTTRACHTHLELLPGARPGHHHRRADRLAHVEQAGTQGELICECELVERSAVEQALMLGQAVGLDDLRRSTRLGMGTCQGGACAYRAAGLQHDLIGSPAAQTHHRLTEFLQARWKGITPAIAGDQLRQLRLNELLYRDVLGVAEESSVAV